METHNYYTFWVDGEDFYFDLTDEQVKIMQKLDDIGVFDCPYACFFSTEKYNLYKEHKPLAL